MLRPRSAAAVAASAAPASTAVCAAPGNGQAKPAQATVNRNPALRPESHRRRKSKSKPKRHRSKTLLAKLINRCSKQPTQSLSNEPQHEPAGPPKTTALKVGLHCQRQCHLGSVAKTVPLAPTARLARPPRAAERPPGREIHGPRAPAPVGLVRKRAPAAQASVRSRPVQQPRLQSCQQ